MENCIIVGEQYCKPHPVELAFSTTINGVKNKELIITNLDGEPVFWLARDVALRNKWFILDATTGLPLLSIIKKSGHEHWRVFRGESKDEKNHLFTVKAIRSSCLKIHKGWDVILAADSKEVEWDFKIIGKYRNRSIKVKRHPTATIVAEMSQHEKVVKVILAKDAFRVTISPHMDFAFIATLISMLHQYLQQKRDVRLKVIRAIIVALGAGTVAAVRKFV